ncbi:hypothetical protein KP509_34G016200, partial [Ceratopteris richardii]
VGDKLHLREGNSPDHQLRPLNGGSLVKEMNRTMRSAEAVGCQSIRVGECSVKGRSTSSSRCRQSGRENVHLSNTNSYENPMPE